VGFGDEFKEMSDREILVSLYKDVQQLNIAVARVKCPSPLCVSHTNTMAEHDNRLQQIEDLITKKDSRKQDRYVIYALIISAVAGWGGLIIAIADLMSKGGV
jgi:hypothetical protein